MVILGRTQARLDDVASRTGCFPVVADVGDAIQVEAAFDAVHARYARLDGVLSNAATAVPEALLHKETLATWDSIIRTNLRGTFLVMQQALRTLVDQGHGGSIVCSTSVVAERAIPGGSNAYTASKGAINALVRLVAIDYAAVGIRVNAIAPGATETALMWQAMPGAHVRHMRRMVEAAVPLRRLASPEEIAFAAAWLLSDEARYVTGTVLTVDGGANAASVLPL